MLMIKTTKICLTEKTIREKQKKHVPRKNHFIANFRKLKILQVYKKFRNCLPALFVVEVLIFLPANTFSR